MRKFALTAALAASLASAGLLATPAFAQNAAAPAAAKAGYSSADTPIGDLLEDPAARAVLDKYLPGFSEQPQIDMVRTNTLKGIQMYAPDKVTDDILSKIDGDLSKLTPKSK